MRRGLPNSAILTFVLVLFTEATHRWLRHRRFGTALTILLCAVTCQTATLVILLAIGTPELLATLLPPIVIGTLFITAYVLALHRADRTRPPAAPPM